MRSATPAVVMLVVAALIGCSTVQVSQDYDPDAAPLPIRTWQWRDAQQPQTGDLRVDNPLVDMRIRRAVEHHLASRGMRIATTAPDAEVSYHLAIVQRLQSDTFGTTMGVGSYYYPWYGGLGTETRIYDYDECQLAIDIQAADTGRLLWRGTGVFRFRTYKDPQEATEAMQQTVDKILMQFPPPAKK